MKIFSAKQIREWDQYTIRHEPISSLNLMERAAIQCSSWILQQFTHDQQIVLFCGPGNNGGDGLAIARLLHNRQYPVKVYILQQGVPSADFSANLQRLTSSTDIIHYIHSITDFPALAPQDIVIDALFGSGLNRALEGLAAQLVDYINSKQQRLIAIDIPSGLSADSISVGPCIKAGFTLTFQQLKLAFLIPENQDNLGQVTVLDIQLHPAYYAQTESPYEMVTPQLLHRFYKPRKQFAHKGNFGNLALIAGSDGMMGAAVMAARACLRSGAGKLTCYIPANGYNIMQTAVPEAMSVTDASPTHHTATIYKGKYDGYAIGPGLGDYGSNVTVIKTLLALQPHRLVADADALNTMAKHPDLLPLLPPGTIITPHIKEFERLFGPSSNHLERIQRALTMANKLNITIILKGHFSCIATAEGKAYFNPTGNPGMATGGSGDVLTGILLGLGGQYSNYTETALLGVYLHGLAGDIAAAEKTAEAMIAGDIIDYLPAAFKTIQTTQGF